MDLAPLIFGFAFVCAALMGFAIQRGATCMVAAIDELVLAGRASRTLALLEAAVWVAGAMVLLKIAGLTSADAPAHPAGVRASLGGILLGWGALINRACMFGTIARLGSGQRPYAATPVGFLLGCIAAAPLVADDAVGIAAAMPWVGWTASIAVAAGLLAAARLSDLGAAVRARAFSRHLWSPRHATLVIALTFVALMTVAGPWTYTDWLIALALHGMRADPAQGVLFIALLGGSVVGGYTADKVRRRQMSLAAVARSLAGGFAMGFGGLLVPGGNDGLILIGLPFLHGYALLALTAMAATIAAGACLRGRRGNTGGLGESA